MKKELGIDELERVLQTMTATVPADPPVDMPELVEDAISQTKGLSLVAANPNELVTMPIDKITPQKGATREDIRAAQARLYRKLMIRYAQEGVKFIID